MDKRNSYTSNIKGEVMQRVVFGKSYAFIKTSDDRLLIQEVKPAPFLPIPEPSEEEINQEIIQMRKDGETLEAIGLVFHLSPTTISKITKHLKMPPVRKKRGRYLIKIR